MTVTWTERLSKIFNHPSKFLIPLLFILNVVLVFPIFFPNLSDIFPWDEAGYINSGRLLVSGESWNRLPVFTWNPLLAFLYAPIYLIFQSSTFWLIHSCTTGRFILFGLLWFSAYLVARQLRHLSHPFILIALLLVSPGLTYLLTNPSDALFTAMSAFALWQVLFFYNERKAKHVWFASLFVGLSALSRNDGLLLFPIFVLLVVIVSAPIKRMRASLVASIIPFSILVGGYFLMYGLIMGKFELGTMKRTYLAFEQGQGITYEYPVPDGTLDVRRIYGAPEENQYSIISAIKRNPKAFFDRVRQTIKTSPTKVYFMYGERAGIIILLLAALGVVEIARKRLYLIFMILLLWPAYLSIYYFTFFRSPYFLFPFFIVFSLASISLNFILYYMNKRRPYIWTILLFGLAILGLTTNRPNVFSATLIFLMGLWIIKIIVNRYQDHEAIEPIAIILALSILLFVKVGYPLPKFRTLGIAPDEKAVLFMKKHLKPGSLVFAEAPGPIWEANMNFAELDFTLRNEDEEHLSRDHLFKSKAVYVNDALRYYEPGLVSKIEGMIGKGLEVGYESEKKEVQVLLVEEKYSSKQSTCSFQCH